MGLLNLPNEVLEKVLLYFVPDVSFDSPSHSVESTTALARIDTEAVCSFAKVSRRLRSISSPYLYQYLWHWRAEGLLESVRQFRLLLRTLTEDPICAKAVKSIHVCLTPYNQQHVLAILGCCTALRHLNIDLANWEDGERMAGREMLENPGRTLMSCRGLVSLRCSFTDITFEISSQGWFRLLGSLLVPSLRYVYLVDLPRLVDEGNGSVTLDLPILRSLSIQAELHSLEVMLKHLHLSRLLTHLRMFMPDDMPVPLTSIPAVIAGNLRELELSGTSIYRLKHLQTFERLERLAVTHISDFYASENILYLPPTLLSLAFVAPSVGLLQAFAEALLHCSFLPQLKRLHVSICDQTLRGMRSEEGWESLKSAISICVECAKAREIALKPAALETILTQAYLEYRFWTS